MTLAELNEMDRAGFVDAVGWIFEHSPWVAERVWEQRPFSSPSTLHAAMMAAVSGAPANEQLALIRAHPDLGARARMSTASEGEQSGAGLQRLEAAEFERLQGLNTLYRERFGFPFIYAVKGASKRDILDALESRLAADPDRERAAALEQVYRIAQFRLETLFSCTIS